VRFRRRRTSAFRRVGRALVGLALAAVCWLVVGAALTPMPAALREGRFGASVQFWDRDGELLREVRADDAARAVWVPIDDVGERMIDAMLAAEDRRFDAHVGIDPLAVMRAAVGLARARRVVSGASTITMQLARVVEPHPRTLRGKLGEMAMALRIEASLSKRQILEQYLNRVPFGDGVRGIGAASRYFFDKPPRELSVAEAATLAGIPRGPSYYSLARRPERVLVRRDRVLDRMFDAKMIDRETHARAKAEPLTLQIGKGGFGAPHLVDALLSGSVDPNIPALRGRTDRVETTIDRSLQREVETAASGLILSLSKRNVTAASVLVVDNTSGDVLAWVGSPRWDDDAHGGKNDGVRARRQPGSTLKPFVYGLAMEDLGWTPATVLPDVELHLPTPGGTYSPRNYDERFHGPVRLREALANSYNVPAVFTVNEVGVGRLLDRLHDVGFGTLTETAEFYGPALALGDGEVRLFDLVGAYAAIARGGIHRPHRVVRAAGAVAIAPQGPGRRVMPAPVAAMLADILRDRSARIAAFGEHTALDLPFDVAAKTGTSKGYRDNWTVGFTRDVTVGVWVGNFDGSPMIGVSGITGAAPLFASAMAAATRRRSLVPVPDPDSEPDSPKPGSSEPDSPEPDSSEPGSSEPGSSEPGSSEPGSSEPGSSEHEPDYEHEHEHEHEVGRAKVCALSGNLPGAGCKHVITELLPRGRRLAPCAMHEVVKIDIRNGLLATSTCEERFVAERTFERFDGPFAAWARAAGHPSAPDDESPLCRRGGSRPRKPKRESVVAIRYPHDGAHFVVDPDRPREAQAIPLKVDAPASSAVALFVDGRPAGRAEAGAPVYWALERGEHAIVAEVDGRRTEPVSILVE
jgi:penicillin-binding protein 1C